MRRRKRKSREGIAIVMALTAITILALVVSEMHLDTSTAYRVAFAQRDRFQAEQLARSALNLSRLLVSIEPQVRATVTPIYQLAVRRAPPQLPMWNFSNALLSPFCDFEGSADQLAAAGVASASVEGLGETPGICEILAASENAKLNVNLQIGKPTPAAKKSIATQLFAMTGGPIQPNPYDDIFNKVGPLGQLNSRQDVIAGIIDWWDADQQGTSFEPTSGQVVDSGTEDDIYNRASQGYRIKNAPFDSIEELRMIRGVSPEFWANFVSNDPSRPAARKLTIYGVGSINPNEAPPEVMLSQLCALEPEATLCLDPQERAKFVQLVSTARMMLPLPFFTRGEDFTTFIEGKGKATDLYPVLKSFLGESSELLFNPVQLSDEARTGLAKAFDPNSQVLSIDALGFVGESRVRLRTVVNFHERWTPPPPNGGGASPLGVVHYYRVD